MGMERGTASFQGYTYKYKIYKFRSEHRAVQVQAQKTLLRAWGDGWRRGGGGKGGDVLGEWGAGGGGGRGTAEQREQYWQLQAKSLLVIYAPSATHP